MVEAKGQQSRAAVTLGVFLLICVVVFFWVRSSWRETQQKLAQERAAQAAAEAVCYLYYPDPYKAGAAATTLPAVFPTEQATLLYQSAIRHQDVEATREALLHSRLVEPGTRADTLERKPMIRRVNVAGAEGWTTDDVCQRQPPR